MQNKKEGVKLARRPKKDQPAPPVAPAPAPAPAASATAVPATSRDSVYREAKAADEELRKLVADGKVQLDRSVTQSRNRLRQHLESLLFIDYAFAQQKDIELQLWKNCFYKVIEEYRARIRKLSRAAAKDASAGTPPASAPAATAAATASSAAAKHKEELDALCAQFRAFLAQSHRFYFNLISRLCAAHGLKTDGSVDLHPLLADASGAPSVPRAYVSVHRSLIYLGDLARYHRDLVGEDTRKDWAQAARYYDQAILLFPWIGNPYNQLAVLAAYDADHLAVFYFYARALSCEAPFVTARENAASAIERNRVRLAGGGSGGGSGAKRAEGEEELFATDAPTDGLSEAERETVSLYGSHLVRIFGMLFTRTALEALPDAETAALRYLDALLSAGLANEQLLVRSVLCLVFMLWHLSPPLPTGTGPSAPFAEVAQRANLLRLATRFTLRFVSVLCRAYRPQWHPTALPALALLADWLALRPELLHPTTGEDTAPWQQLWPALVNLSNVLNVEPIPAPVPPQARDALPEEWEARGFIPLALAVAPLTFSGPKRHAKVDAAHALRLRSHKWSVVLGQLLASPPDARRAFFYSTHHTPHYSTSPQLPSHAAASPVVSHASAHSSVAVNGVPSAVQSVSVARASAYTPPIQPPSPVLAPLPTPEAKPHSQETPAFKPAPAPVPTDSDLLEDEVILFAPQAETDVANLLASSVDEGPNSTSDPTSAIPLPQMEAPPEDDDDDLIVRSPHTSASGNFPSASWTPFGGSGSFFTPMAEQRGPAPPGFSAFQQPHASAWPSQPSGGSFFGDLPDGEELEALEPVAPSGPPGFDPKPSAAIYRNRGTGRASVIQPIRQPRGPDSGVRGFAKRGGSVA